MVSTPCSRAAGSSRPTTSTAHTAYPRAGAASAAQPQRGRVGGAVRATATATAAVTPSAATSSPTRCGHTPRPPARSTAPRPNGDDVSTAGTSAAATSHARAEADAGARQKSQGGDHEAEPAQHEDAGVGCRRSAQGIGGETDLDREVESDSRRRAAATHLVDHAVADVARWRVGGRHPLAHRPAVDGEHPVTGAQGRLAVRPDDGDGLAPSARARQARRRRDRGPVRRA